MKSYKHKPHLLGWQKHLAYYEPAEGYVANPGMGINCYSYSDHMHKPDDQSVPPSPLPRSTFDRMARLPFCDNIYIRVEWRDIQSRKGKLKRMDAWDWTLDAVARLGKRWSFRIMQCSPHSMREHSLPDFLEGKLKMISYQPRGKMPGPKIKYFPAYEEEYFKWWGEMLHLLAERYDSHPALEYADISGIGFWGEWHHHGGKVIPAGREFAVYKRIIDEHLSAFKRTPAVMHANFGTDSLYRAVAYASERGCWFRRDSFQWAYGTRQCSAHMNRSRPGSGQVWEPARFWNHGRKDPVSGAEMPLTTVPQRVTDVGSHFFQVGFNPWNALFVWKNHRQLIPFIQQRIGFRIRPSVVWSRGEKAIEQTDNLALGLTNDGYVGPSGELTVHADFGSGRGVDAKVGLGLPLPHRMEIVHLPLPKIRGKILPVSNVKLRISLSTGKKRFPIRWAVKSHPTVKEDGHLISIPIPPDVR
jgi:hypothetical protein